MAADIQLLVGGINDHLWETRKIDWQAMFSDWDVCLHAVDGEYTLSLPKALERLSEGCRNKFVVVADAEATPPRLVLAFGRVGDYHEDIAREALVGNSNRCKVLGGGRFHSNDRTFFFDSYSGDFDYVPASFYAAIFGDKLTKQLRDIITDSDAVTVRVETTPKYTVANHCVDMNSFDAFVKRCSYLVPIRELNQDNNHADISSAHLK